MMNSLLEKVLGWWTLSKEILVGEEKEPSTLKTEEESPYKNNVNSISKPISSSRVHLDKGKTPRKEWDTKIDNWAHNWEQAQSVLIPVYYQSWEGENSIDYLAASIKGNVLEFLRQIGGTT